MGFEKLSEFVPEKVTKIRSRVVCSTADLLNISFEVKKLIKFTSKNSINFKSKNNINFRKNLNLTILKFYFKFASNPKAR